MEFLWYRRAAGASQELLSGQGTSSGLFILGHKVQPLGLEEEGLRFGRHKD